MAAYHGPMLNLRTLLASVGAACALGGCGVGIGIDIGPDDDPPSVSLTSTPGSAAAGQAVRLSADARDDGWIDEVAFYRLEPDGRSTYLGRDTSAAYELNALVPATALRGSTVFFFARAYDDVGQSTDSVAVGVSVL